MRWLVVVVALCACKGRAVPDAAPREGPIDPVSVRVTELLGQLRGDDLAEREDAIGQIRGLTSRRALETEEGIALLRALSTLRGAEQTAIVAALVEDPRMPYLPVIEAVAPALDATARTWAIALVGMIDDPAAARTFLRLLERHPGASPSLAFAHLQGHPQQPRVLFPALLDFLDRPVLFDDVLSTALAYCEAGRLPPELLAGHAPRILAIYREAREQLVPRQQVKGTAWRWAESYAETREDAALLLDLMGCMPAELVVADLEAALDYRDPRLLYFATRSLLTHGRAPRGPVLAALGADRETRVWLFDLVADAGRPELFPSRWRTQPALAESQLAGWIARADQRGRVPDEMELLDVVTIDAGPPDGELDFFVFRFRWLPPDELAADGWLAGVAGPYVRGDQPTTDDHGGTFSRYERADARTPAEHVGPRDEILRAWRER